MDSVGHCNIKYTFDIHPYRSCLSSMWHAMLFGSEDAVLLGLRINSFNLNLN